MTSGLVRYQETGDLHFVIFSCYHRQPYLGLPAARELFEHSLETMRRRYDFFVTAYVVMPEHVHLLVSEPKGALLATALQALKLSVSVQSRERPFSGSGDTTTSTSAEKSWPKSAATSTATRSRAGWLSSRISGSGPAFATGGQARRAPSR